MDPAQSQSESAHYNTANRATRLAHRMVRERCVVVRPARTESDIVMLVKYGRQAVVEAGMSELGYSEEIRIKRALQAFRDKKRFIFLLAERRGNLIGVLCAQVSDAIFNDSSLASVIFFYVSPEARNGLAAVKLLQAVLNWARVRNANEVQIYVTSGANIGRTDRFLRRLGFKQIGGNYSIGLSPVAEGRDKL